jgi:hypothetical protein
MSVGEYVAVFVSIILGIALGDLALSTHRLLRARHRVEWHWVTPPIRSPFWLRGAYLPRKLAMQRSPTIKQILAVSAFIIVLSMII